MSLADLVAAGAPELPDGYFYRVTEVAFFGATLEIRERRRFGSRLLMVARIREDRADDGLSAIVDACHRAVAHLDEVAVAQEKSRQVRALYGDHDLRGTR